MGSAVRLRYGSTGVAEDRLCVMAAIPVALLALTITAAAPPGETGKSTATVPPWRDREVGARDR